jgi:hypothetical protein
MTLPRIERPDQSEHLNMILYGDSGVGKTYLLGTSNDCPETSPSLLIDFEKGTRTLHGRDIDIFRPDTWSEIQDVLEFFMFENDKYKSVLLDSATEVQKKFSMGSILGYFDGPAPDLGSTVAPSIKDWNRTGDQMRRLIRGFRDLAYLSDRSKRVHVVITCLERMNDKRQLVSPQLSGALGEECGALVDFLMRLSKQRTIDEDETVERRYLLTSDHINEDGIKYLGKSRGTSLPKGIWEPNMTKIMSHLNGENTDD